MKTHSANPARSFLHRTYREFHHSEIRRQLLKRSGTRPLAIDVTHPFFMYLSAAQGRDYEAAISQPEFQAHIYTPISLVYQEAFSSLRGSLKDPYDYIDLGPGYTSYLAIVNQSLFHFRKPRFYIPVDVNNYLLNKLCRYTRRLHLTTIPFNTLFELLPSQLESVEIANGPAQRLFSLGLTFNNYSLPQATRLMRQLLSHGGSLLLCGEEPTSVSVRDLLAPYENAETQSFNRESISALSLPRSATQYTVSFTRHRIEMGFKVLADTRLPDDSQFRKGDFLRTCVSYRHNATRLLSLLRKDFRIVRMLSRSSSRAHSAQFYTILVSKPTQS